MADAIIPLPAGFVPRFAGLDLPRTVEPLLPDAEAFFVVPVLVDFDAAFIPLDDLDFALPFVELALAEPDDLPPVLFLADDDLFDDELLAPPPVLVLVDEDFDFELELDDFDAPDFAPDDREVDDLVPEDFFVVGIFRSSNL